MSNQKITSDNTYLKLKEFHVKLKQELVKRSKDL